MIQRSAVPVYLILFVFFVANTSTAKPPYTDGEEHPIMSDFSPYLIDHLKNDTGESFASLSRDDRFQKLVTKHNLKLLTGPMLGRMTGTSVDVWLRTPTPATVRVIAKPTGSSDRTIQSPPRETRRKKDLIAEVPLIELSPDTSYRYQVTVDGTPVFPEQDRPSFTTYPRKGQSGSFRVSFAACSRYIPKNEYIWNRIQSYDPRAFLTLGDNLYIDTPRNFSKNRLHYYRRQLRPEWRNLTASTSIYAIWDDHDFGKNDSAGGTKPFQPEWKPKVWNIFRQNWINPGYGGGADYPGTWFDFYIGDVHVIMTDGRYYRDFGKGTMLGERQLNWLLETIKNSRGTFKIIASSTLWTRKADKGGADSWWGVKNERKKIFDTIAEHDVNGVVLISGDRHRGDVYKMKWSGDYPLWEFENARLTNIHRHGARDQAQFSYSTGEDLLFGLFDVNTSAPDPTLKYRLIADNKERTKTVYEKTLKLSEISN